MTKYTKESILAIVEEFYEKNGRPPRMDEMNSRHGLPTMATFKKLTGTTPGQYLRGRHPQAEKPRKRPSKGEKRKGAEQVVEEYRRFYEEYRRMPTTKDCKERKLAYPSTFKSVTGFSPWAYFRNEQVNAARQKENPPQEPIQENEPFILELLNRLGASVNDVAIRTDIPAQQIRDLLNRGPSEEFRQLYAIARALNVPMEVLYRAKP